MDELLRWREFYAAVAGAAAALVGLVYIGVSIQVGRGVTDRHVRQFGTMSAQNFLHPLLVALAMLLPVVSTVQGGLLLVLGVAGVVNTVITVHGEVIRAQHRPPERRLMTLYRYGMTLAAAAVLTVGGAALLSGADWALYLPAVFVFLMFFVGVENAWALLVGNAQSARTAQANPDDAPRLSMKVMR